MSKIKKEYALMEFVLKDGLSVDVMRELYSFEKEEDAIKHLEWLDYGEYYIVPKYICVSE